MPRPKPKFPIELRNKVIELYTNNVAINKIITILPINYRNIRKILEEERITIRSRNEARTTHLLNTNVFDSPLSSIALYFLGIMLTDGSIQYRNGHSPRVRLSLTDKDVIYKFKEFLEYSGEVNISPPRTIKHIPQYQLEISSTILTEKLVNLGCTPNKTFTVIAPNSVTHSRDFWRGCIDGDGCLHDRYTLRNTSPCLSFVSASEQFSEQFANFCKEYGSSTTVNKRHYRLDRQPTYRVILNGIKALNIACVLYKNCCFAMTRKLSRYREQYQVFPD